MTKMSELLLLVSVFTVALACQAERSCNSEGDATVVRTSLPIGAACTRADGYQPTISSGCPWDASTPTACPVPAGFVDYHQLPPGVGYCLGPGGLYPHGYFTMNCSRDSDCPAGARCDGTQCRQPCQADQQCQAPSICRDGPGGTRFCQCPSCIQPMGLN
jgi:hypothetical protein